MNGLSKLVDSQQSKGCLVSKNHKPTKERRPENS